MGGFVRVVLRCKDLLGLGAKKSPWTPQGLRRLAFVSFLAHNGGSSKETVNPQAPELPIQFYRTKSGREPVLGWLRDLPKADRHVIGQDLMRVQVGWPIGMPLVRSLKDGLWEVRSTLPSQRIARLILGFHDGMIVVLHGFIKKTQRTPADDISLARQRMKEVTT